MQPQDDNEQWDELDALYARTCPSLIGLLTLIGGSRADAEEVAHDAFVRLLDRWSTVRTYEDPAGWVRQVAVRALISRKRRQQVAARMLGRLGAGRAWVTAGRDGTGVDLDRALTLAAAAATRGPRPPSRRRPHRRRGGRPPRRAGRHRQEPPLPGARGRPPPARRSRTERPCLTSTTCCTNGSPQ